MSLLCPIDFRYGRPQMKRIFEEEARLQRLLDVEAALARAESKVGLVPREAAAEITKKATTKLVTVKRVERSEEHTSELQSLTNLVCRLLLEKKKKEDEPT